MLWHSLSHFDWTVGLQQRIPQKEMSGGADVKSAAHWWNAERSLPAGLANTQTT